MASLRLQLLKVLECSQRPQIHLQRRIFLVYQSSKALITNPHSPLIELSLQNRRARGCGRRLRLHRLRRRF